MNLFTSEEYNQKYSKQIDVNLIEEASDMIFAQISPQLRDYTWTNTSVPTEIKRACLVQANFLQSYEIPDIDYKKVDIGEMKADIKSHYSTYALTILSNAGYLYRGSIPQFNLTIPFGS